MVLTANRSGHAGVRLVVEQAVRVRPVPHEDGLTTFKRKPRLFFLPCEDRRRHDVVDVDRITHEGERLLRRRPSRRARVPRRRISPPKAPRYFEKHRHETFVASALPDQPERNRVLALSLFRKLNQIGADREAHVAQRRCAGSSMPTSTNHGSESSAPFQRSAVNAAAKKLSVDG